MSQNKPVLVDTTNYNFAVLYLVIGVDDGGRVMHARMLVGSMGVMRWGWVAGVDLVVVPAGPLHARSHGHHNIDL